MENIDFLSGSNDDVPEGWIYGTQLLVNKDFKKLFLIIHNVNCYRIILS